MVGKIHVIEDIQDPLLYYIKDDPVRPNMYAIERIVNNKEVIVLIEDSKPAAIVCVCYQNFIPTTEEELLGSNDATFAVFYTIWSYKPGSGKKLLSKAKDYIKENRKNIERFITLSPLTFTASRFHTSNGAKVLRVNTTSVNYEYK